MGIFQLVYFLCNVIRRIFGRDGANGLEDYFTLIVMRIDLMNGNAGERIPVGPDCLVYAHSIHAFAAIFRQQGRVDIDHVMFVLLQYVRWN